MTNGRIAPAEANVDLTINLGQLNEIDSKLPLGFWQFTEEKMKTVVNEKHPKL